MADSVPEDVMAWLKELGQGAEPLADREMAKQLKMVLRGPLLQRVFWKLSQRVEAAKQLLLKADGSDLEALAELRRTQAEVRGITVVLELLWETADEVA